MVVLVMVTVDGGTGNSDGGDGVNSDVMVVVMVQESTVY